MATKKETLEAALRGEGCLGKAADDEPVFVIRAQDMFSEGTIWSWTSRAAKENCNPQKIEEALQTAAAMAKWPHKKLPD